MRHVTQLLTLIVILLNPAQSNSAERSLWENKISQSPPAPAFNLPSKAKVQLGEKLFFDTRLSGNNTFACSTCHIPKYGWTDRKQFSSGETGELRPRRTPSLQDVGWNKRFARDGRIDTLEGFVLGPIAHPKEMNQNLDILPDELNSTVLYPQMFEAAFGDDTISVDVIAQSLATYIRTLQTSNSPFDRWIDGDRHAMSVAAVAGFRLFNGKAGCAECHSGWRFSDQKFHDIGLQTNDLGRGAITPEDPKMFYAFKTPSLRNVAIRSPFMHNGELETLSAVIDHYGGTYAARPSVALQVKSLELTVQEKVNLIEFLRSLTDDKHLNQLIRIQD